MILLGLVLACSPSPGLLVVVLDTTRADLGGAPAPSWPEARQYTRAWSAASYTSMSVPTLLTGRWPAALGRCHDIRDPYIPPVRAATWLEVARDVGLPTLVATDQYVVAALGVEDMGTAVRHLDHEEGSAPVFAAAAAWIEVQQAPWVAYVHVWGPHAPYSDDLALRQEWASIAGGRAPFDPAAAERARRAYAAGVARTLEALDELVEALPEGTTVLATSDHGEAFGEDGLYMHGSGLHDSQVHVPLWVWGPGALPGEDETPLGATAVADTALAWIGGLPPGGCDLRQGSLGCDAPVAAMCRGATLHERVWPPPSE